MLRKRFKNSFCKGISKSSAILGHKKLLFLLLSVFQIFNISPVIANTSGIFENTPTETSSLQQQPIVIRGTITDDTGEPLPGATVILKSKRSVAVVSDANGKYVISIPSANETLIFSLMGMEQVEVKINPTVTTYNVKLKYLDSQLKEVVVETGLFQRDKVSFTGATNTVSGTELRTTGNQNIIQSLKTLDPSFIVLDNMEFGSNPNQMSSIELRGQGAATLNAVKDEFNTDPNRPLFVLNGVEVTLQRIIDLDINRVESVTILKDAGSTAIYGSRGANGVVVIETKKPKPGELKVAYSGDFAIQAPDLSVFNMMNAAEKLEFERLSGKYKVNQIGGNQSGYQLALDQLYNMRLKDVQRGVDTYWLSEPVQTGFTHGHSVRVSGGNNELTVDAGAKYKNMEGVMKGSGRETWEGNVTLNYRTEKLIVTNDLSVSGYTAKESPYGNYSTWVNTSPYFTKTNENGEIDMFLQYKWGLGSYGLESPITANIANPLYDAKLNSKNEENQLYVSNSLQLQYNITDNLRLKGGIDLSRTHKKRILFTPPEHTSFYEKSIYEKGTYHNKDTKQLWYLGHIGGTYAHTLDKNHRLVFSTRAEIRENQNNYITVDAVGFPYNSNGSPNLAHSYKEESRPDYYLAKSRGVGVVGTFNYSYDYRYLFDFSFRVDGSSTFGSKELYKTFWSTGIGWNIDRESFAKDWEWLTIMKIRATTGSSGNQNIGSVSSSSIYQYYVESNVFGQGAYLHTLANPNLPWQVSKDMGAGIDLSMLKGRFSLTFDIYRKKTDPLIINVPQIPSTGVYSYPMDLGHSTNKGVEFRAAFSPIYNLKDRIIWTFSVMGAHNKAKYGGLGNKLDSFNEKQRTSNTMEQYMDGYSPNDIWAVRSNGIDPATGEEIFIKKNGELTFNYDADDMVVVGSTRPDIIGVVSTSFRYKDFSTSVNFRYSIGSDIYNSALYNKVENISRSALERNQDKRALYDRWKNPGDISEYKSIAIVANSSPKTSRFVQKNNYLNAESISFSYDLYNNPWLKKNLGAETVKISAYLNDIFRIETSKTERGIEYPFSRTISLGINIGF